MLKKIEELYKNKVINKNDIYSVYAIIVFFVYTWAIFVSFYKLPSWILYLRISEILSIYAYTFFFCFLESLIVLAAVLFLEYTILFFINRDGFYARTLLLFFVIFIVSVVRLTMFFDIDQIHVFLSMEKGWWLLTLLSLPLILALSTFSQVQVILNKLAESMKIFVYIYFPISMISCVVVLIRNVR